SFYQTQNQYYGFARVDYAPISKLRLFASWEDLYTRLVGNTLPTPDSKLGQVNSNATSDPTTFRADAGQVIPAAIYAFGADYTITSNLLLSARYGYLFNNAEDRGKPTGVRALFDTPSTTAKGLDGSSVPAAYQQIGGYSNLGTNTQQKLNVLK